MNVISNTTVISNFASVKDLQLLYHLYSTIYVSTEVFNEIQTGIAEGYSFYNEIEHLIYPLNQTGWIHLTGLNGGEELHTLGRLPSSLHPGESSCIAIASHRKWLFLSDDLAARNHARRNGIRVSGTLGCLILAVERSIYDMDDANELLHKMIQQGFHAPVTDLSSLLK